MVEDTRQSSFLARYLTSSWQNKQSLSLRDKLQIIFLMIGIVMVVFGLFLKSRASFSNSKVEVLETNTPFSSSVSSLPGQIEVDVSGAVASPGVYKLKIGDRVQDAIDISGGITSDADKNWIDKNLNKAAKLIDGQKIFVPYFQQSSVLGAKENGANANVAQSYSEANGKLVNINTATLAELDSLPGIGPVYGQNIIDNRPYSDVSELLSKKVLKESVYNKVKELVSVY